MSLIEWLPLALKQDAMPKTIHEGHNVKRFREMLGIKQETLAAELGDDWSQKKISQLESKEVIEEDLLKQIAEILKVPTDAIKNFDEESAMNFIGNTYHNHDNSSTLNGQTINYNPTFNPLEKYIEAIEEIKKLYEALLQSEREKIALYEKLLGEKK